jgi:hypothetical protein
MRQPPDDALDRSRGLEGMFDSQHHSVRVNATKRMTSLNVLRTDSHASADRIIYAVCRDQ